MKQIIMTGACLMVGLLFAAEPAKDAKAAKAVSSSQRATSAKTEKMTLAEAREKISDVIRDPELMGEVVKQLDAGDQNTFLAEVNRAIAAMPVSNEKKTATFLDVNREALLSAKKGNLQAMVATMFASTKLEGLSVMADRYGEDLFNRASDATKTFTDEQFTEIASSTVKEVAKACEGLTDAAPRDTLAVYLFEKASNGTIPDLEDKLLEIAISDSATRAIAKGEWLAEAKNSEDGSKFTTMLASVDAGPVANVDVVLRIAGPQVLTATLNDLAQGVMGADGQQIMPITQGENPTERGITTPGQAQAVTTATQDSKPITADPTSPYNPSYSRSEVEEAKEEAKKYQFQD